MALAVVITNKRYDTKTVRVWFTVTASGTYPTGGDTLSFAGLGLQGVSLAPLWCEVQGINGFIYAYVFGSPASLSNGKMKAFVEQAVATNTPLAEHTNVAYVAGITGDTIVGYADFLLR